MKNSITYCYPKSSDVDLLLNFINTLSREQTFTRKQGHQFTRAEEEVYLKDFLKEIVKHPLEGYPFLKHVVYHS